jgi:hypothetical protein
MSIRESAPRLPGAAGAACLLLAASAGCTEPKPAEAPRSEGAALPAIPAAPSSGLHDQDEARAANVKRSPAQPLVRNAEGAISCGKLASLPLASEPAPVLGGLLTVRPPQGAESTPRSYNIMSAPASPQDETRIKTDAGGESFAILAVERYQLDPDVEKAEPDAIVKPGSLDEEAPKFLEAVYGSEEVALDIEPVSVGPGKLRGYAGRPKKLEAPAGHDSALALALLVVMPDATLESIGFYVTPGLLPDGEGCIRLAERVADTLDLGPRKMERGAGMRRLARANDKEDYVVDVPDNYVLSVQPGHDFVTYHLHKLRPIGLFPGQIAIAFDPYPDSSLPAGATVQATGNLLGKPAEWKGEKFERGGYLVVIEPLPSAGGGKLFLQVVVQATRQAKYLDEFRKVAETLTRAPRAK